jgi:hypothetical protein
VRHRCEHLIVSRRIEPRDAGAARGPEIGDERVRVRRRLGQRRQDHLAADIQRRIAGIGTAAFVAGDRMARNELRRLLRSVSRAASTTSCFVLPVAGDELAVGEARRRVPSTPNGIARRELR